MPECEEVPPQYTVVAVGPLYRILKNGKRQPLPRFLNKCAADEYAAKMNCVK